MDSGTSVKVAVRIRPLSSEETEDDGTLCINSVPGEPQVTLENIAIMLDLITIAIMLVIISVRLEADVLLIIPNQTQSTIQIIAGTDAFFTFDHVFGVESSQSQIYDECVSDLVNGKSLFLFISFISNADLFCCVHMIDKISRNILEFCIVTPVNTDPTPNTNYPVLCFSPDYFLFHPELSF